MKHTARVTRRAVPPKLRGRYLWVLMKVSMNDTPSRPNAFRLSTVALVWKISSYLHTVLSELLLFRLNFATPDLIFPDR